MSNFYITKNRLEELKIELENLKKEGRKDVAAKLKRAKEYGDLSENAEYSEAKDEQARVENRIFELENILRNVNIIKKSSGKDTVQIGSTIEIKKSGRGGDKILKYTIVGSNEAKPEANLISNESPLGRAFLNKKKGEKIKIETLSGKTEYEIMKIE
ncbi:transcription elongation factor GreA [Candidatus Wolfebacteria bacterium]|nr:transcription elongation factor GreA [Candidatus Wolfebacteria bacterium]